MKARDPKTPGGIESTGCVDSVARESGGGAKYYMFWSLGDWETQVIILLSRVLLPYPTPHLSHHVTVSLAPASLVLPSVLAFHTLLNLERKILSAHASFDPSEPCKTNLVTMFWTFVLKMMLGPSCLTPFLQGCWLPFPSDLSVLATLRGH